MGCLPVEYLRYVFIVIAFGIGLLCFLSDESMKDGSMEEKKRG